MEEKDGLPPYTYGALEPLPLPSRCRNALSRRRRRALRFVVVSCLVLIVFAQWKQVWRSRNHAPSLSLERLKRDLATCRRLRHTPEDPVGLGREKNARYIDGQRPTLIRNATVWIGEAVPGTSAEDARAGKGWRWETRDVLLEKGLIKAVERHISSTSLPKDTKVYDAAGRQLTSGIIDMHSHAGVFALPSLNGNDDGNEFSDKITPWARSIDALDPFDPQFQVIKSGGVTTSLILPGSSNNIAGEGFLVKHAVGKPDGRSEIGVRDMLADPDGSWRYMKMACGENPKIVGAETSTVARRNSRMGESFDFRRAFEQATALVQRQDDWCDKAESSGVESMDEYLPQDITWEPLGAALRGQVHVNVHCYTVTDLEAMVDHSNEFKFAVRSFHHAHQSYLVPETLRRTYGGRAPSSALFADNMYYKSEAYIGSEFAGKYLYENGLTPVYVSDNPVLNAQHVLFEAAKAYHYGLPYHAALASVTTAPAEELGMGQRIGKIKPGYDADVVVWDSDPLSVGAAPVQVWIDGTSQLHDPIELSKRRDGPLVADESLSHVEEPRETSAALFRGVNKVLLSGNKTYERDGERSLNVAVKDGKISCIGHCGAEFATARASGVEVVSLKNGYLTDAFTGVAGNLGLGEIDAEPTTENGNNAVKFTRAIDGLQLGGKKLRVGARYGVTRAISAPKLNNLGTHHGTSVGFVTTARTSLEKGAVFAQDVAVHYTVDVNSRAADSYSAAFGELRRKLLRAAKGGEDVADAYSEAAYLQKVVEGTMVLALTVNSADGIATALRIKAEVEGALRPSSLSSSSSSSSRKLRLAIIGGAESHLVAAELAAASVGVILLPLQATALTWDARRALPGAPLTNGTAVDWLVAAGVTVAVGLPEDWRVRDLGFEAGVAYRNGNGRISEKAALDMVSINVHTILGAKADEDAEGAGDAGQGHFMVSEGSPLEIGSRIKAVGTGRGSILAFGV